MAPRTSWKGFLKLSLVSVPVKAYTAHNTADEVRLNQLHAECHGRVKYKKVCTEHGELKSDEIVSGYEYAKDQYVIIEPDELARLRPESDRSVAIDGFVPRDEIDPIQLAGKTYYLLPDGVAGNRPYALIARGMADNGLCAMAQVVISGRQQLCVVHPVDGLLVLSILHVAKRIKAREEFVDLLPGCELGDEELALTQTLIDASTLGEFDFGAYKDEHSESLARLIQMKVDGQEIVQAPDPEEPRIINLMDALKRSVAEAQAAGAETAAAKPAKVAAKKKVAASAKGRRKAASKKAASAKGTTKKAKRAPSAGRKTAARKSG